MAGDTWQTVAACLAVASAVAYLAWKAFAALVRRQGEQISRCGTCPLSCRVRLMANTGERTERPENLAQIADARNGSQVQGRNARG